MKRVTSIFRRLGAAVIAAAAASSAVGQTRTAYPYKAPVNGEIAVVATGVLRDRQPLASDTLMQQVADCGFNMVSLVGTIDIPKRLDEFKRSLANAREAGLGVLAANYFWNLNGHDPKAGTMWAKKYLDEFRDDPTIVAWQLKDEPNYDQLTDTTDGYNLQTIYNYIRDNDPLHRPIQVNLVGSPENVFMLGHSYDEFLSAFQSNFRPTLWSFDHYPITRRIKGTTLPAIPDETGPVNVGYQTFYEDLATYNRLSERGGGAFWMYLQSMEYLVGHYLRPVATVPYLSFQAFSALACGAQGILYWTYRNRPDTKSEQYGQALIDLDGEKTPSWDAARTVNHRIRRYNEVFAGSRLMEAIHVGEIYPGCPVMKKRIGPLLRARTEKGGKGMLLTRLRNGDREFLVIVSHDVTDAQQITLTFKDGYKIQELTPADCGDGNAAGRVDSSRPVRRLLPPGGVCIFEI